MIARASGLREAGPVREAAHDVLEPDARQDRDAVPRRLAVRGDLVAAAASSSSSSSANASSASLVSCRQTTSGLRSSSHGSSRGSRCLTELTFQVASRIERRTLPSCGSISGQMAFQTGGGSARSPGVLRARLSGGVRADARRGPVLRRSGDVRAGEAGAILDSRPVAHHRRPASRRALEGHQILYRTTDTQGAPTATVATVVLRARAGAEGRPAPGRLPAGRGLAHPRLRLLVRDQAGRDCPSVPQVAAAAADERRGRGDPGLRGTGLALDRREDGGARGARRGARRRGLRARRARGREDAGRAVGLLGWRPRHRLGGRAAAGLRAGAQRRRGGPRRGAVLPADDGRLPRRRPLHGDRAGRGRRHRAGVSPDGSRQPAQRARPRDARGDRRPVHRAVRARASGRASGRVHQGAGRAGRAQRRGGDRGQRPRSADAGGTAATSTNRRRTSWRPWPART